MTAADGDARQVFPSRRERLGHERVRAPVRLGGHPREHDRADALRRVADRAHRSRSCGLAGSRPPVTCSTIEARVAARVDPVQSEARACSRPASSARYSATFAPATPIASPCAASSVPSAAVEHVADRRGARVAARSAVGRQHREAGPRRARRRPGPAPARLGEGAPLGVAVGTAATALASAALGGAHGDEPTPGRSAPPPAAPRHLAAIAARPVPVAAGSSSRILSAVRRASAAIVSDGLTPSAVGMRAPSAT